MPISLLHPNVGHLLITIFNHFVWFSWFLLSRLNTHASGRTIAFKWIYFFLLPQSCSVVAYNFVAFLLLFVNLLGTFSTWNINKWKAASNFFYSRSNLLSQPYYILHEYSKNYMSFFLSKKIWWKCVYGYGCYCFTLNTFKRIFIIRKVFFQKSS